MRKFTSFVVVASTAALMTATPALAQGFIDKLKNMVEPSSPSSDWELYVKTDDLTDEKTQIAVKRYVVEDVVMESTFECIKKALIFKVTMLDASGEPSGSFDKADERRAIVTYRLDDKPASKTLMTSRYSNSLMLFLDVEPMLGDRIRAEDLLTSNRFRIRMPVERLSNPTLDIDLNSRALVEVVAGCGM